MFFLVQDDLEESVLRGKALELEKVGVHLTRIKLLAECVCCICLTYMYAVLRPGYWDDFLLPCVTTLSVTFISFLFDFYQFWAFLIGRTGCTIFLDNIDPEELGWLLRRGFAVFHVVNALCYFGWVSVGIILATKIHGEDLQKSSDHPIVAWVIATVSAFVASFVTWLFIFVVSFEWTFLSIHLKRFELASAHQDVPVELQQIVAPSLSGPSEQGQERQGSDNAEEDQSSRSSIDEIKPLPASGLAASSSQSKYSRSSSQAHNTNSSVRPVPIAAEGSSAFLPPHQPSDSHVSDQNTLEQGPSRQQPVTFGLSIAWKDRPSATAPVYVKHTGLWQQVRKREEEGE